MHETNAEPDSTQEGPAPDLAASVAGVVNAALGVGVSLARLMAEATALGKTVPPLPSGTPALQAIVRYGVTAMGNLAQAVVSGAQTQSKATSSAGEAAPAAARPSGPSVHAGAVLRVPLSVENPGDRPMPALRPILRRVRRPGGADVTALLAAEAVTFFPPQFDVAAHDFEKLVVQVSTPREIPEGFYELILALGEDEPDLPMTIRVLPPTTA
jgi:hypothetical protein